MKRHNRIPCLACLIAIPLATITTSGDAAWACNAATLNGKYGFNFFGFQSPPTKNTAGALIVPIAGEGLATFDGAGNVSFPVVASVSGDLNTSKCTGTYSVNSDCTGSITSTNCPSSAFVIVGGGAEILATCLPPGCAFNTDFKKQ
jgi:hypothetical protein